VRHPAADAQLPVGDADAIETGHVADVDEQRGHRQAQLEEWDEAVAAGQDLGLPHPLAQQAQGLREVARTGVVELGRDHPRATSVARER
jgi:hypothetical protein